MIIVTNTGPLIAMAKLERLSLLTDLASEVYAPSQVKLEALAKAGPETDILADAFTEKLRVRQSPALDPNTDAILKGLDEGERQAIALARTFASGALLLLDDRGRKGCSATTRPTLGRLGRAVDVIERTRVAFRGGSVIGEGS